MTLVLAGFRYRAGAAFSSALRLKRLLLATARMRFKGNAPQSSKRPSQAQAFHTSCAASRRISKPPPWSSCGTATPSAGPAGGDLRVQDGEPQSPRLRKSQERLRPFARVDNEAICKTCAGKRLRAKAALAILARCEIIQTPTEFPPADRLPECCSGSASAPRSRPRARSVWP